MKKFTLPLIHLQKDLLLLLAGILISAASYAQCSVSILSTNATCNSKCDGTASATPQGGQAPYTFLWMPGSLTTQNITGLCATNYTVGIADANLCTSTATVTISQPVVLTGTISATNVTCNGAANGTASINVSGGTPAYMYLWSPSGGSSSAATGLAPGNYSVLVTDGGGCTSSSTVAITQPQTLAGTRTHTNVTCNGLCNATANIVATGGTTPYSYSWLPSGGSSSAATGLCAGNYTVTLTDANGCSPQNARTYTVTEPAALGVNTTFNATSSCAPCNGSAIAVVTGGTTPYTYLWSPNGGTKATATGLCVADYTLTVTDSKTCIITAAGSITQPAALSITPSANAATACTPCNGSASAAITGGTAPYSYSWSPSGGNSSAATGLCAGVYTVTVVDVNKCTSTATISVGGLTGPTAIIASSSNLMCNGVCTGSVTASATGGTPPYTFAWSPGGGSSSAATGLCAGNYITTVTDGGGCFSSSSNVTISQPAALSTTITLTNATCNSLCNGRANIKVSGGTPGYTYLWSNGKSTSAVTGLCAGTHTVTITDANGCTLSNTYTVTEPAVLVVNLSSIINSTSCAPCNGSISATASGGTSPYVYAWSPSSGTSSTASGLCAGNYSLTITDTKACKQKASVSLTGPLPPVISIASSSPASCNGTCNGSATATTTGGTAPYTYLWSASGGTTSAATGLCAGNYTVLVTESSGCSSSKTVAITQPQALAGGRTHTNVSCNGLCNGIANVVASGGTAPYSYSWSPSGGSSSSASGLCANNYTVIITDAHGCTLPRTYTVTQPAVLATSASAVPSTSCTPCNGTASVTVTGGTTPYTYSWSPAGGNSAGAVGLCAAVYTVSVTDSHACTSKSTISVGGSSGPSAFLTSKNASCTSLCNGSVTASGSGGAPPYTYAWVPSGGSTSSASGLCAGAYTLTISDGSGCFSISKATITQPNTLTGATNQVNILCNGSCTGRANFALTGGTPAYTYVWSPSVGTTALVTGLCAGNYSVVATDANGCSLTNSYTITTPSAIGITASSNASTSCMPCNGSASVSVTGGTPNYTYTWLPSGGSSSAASGLCAGNYTLTVTDGNSCKKANAVNIGGPVGPTVTVTINTSSATVNATGNPSFTYAWSDGQTTQTATGLQTGTYTVCVTDAGGCITCKTVSISLTGITNLLAEGELKIYPNPAGEFVYVEAAFSNPQKINISILNMIGETMMTEDLYSGTYLNKKFYTGNFRQGIYFVRITSESGTTIKKLIMQ